MTTPNERLAMARLGNPRNQVAAAKRGANYRISACCANCRSYVSGRCLDLHCGVKRTTVCDHFATTRQLQQQLDAAAGGSL